MERQRRRRRGRVISHVEALLLETLLLETPEGTSSTEGTPSPSSGNDTPCGTTAVLPSEGRDPGGAAAIIDAEKETTLSTACALRVSTSALSPASTLTSVPPSTNTVGTKSAPRRPFNIGELIEDVAALERVQHADHGDVRGVEILLEVSDLVWIRSRGGRSSGLARIISSPHSCSITEPILPMVTPLPPSARPEPARTGSVGATRSARRRQSFPMAPGAPSTATRNPV